MNDLTFGATLLACFAATVFTVWMEATSPTTPSRDTLAVVDSNRTAKQAAGDHDKSCTTVAAAPIAAR
jgi:hypothetical protein